MVNPTRSEIIRLLLLGFTQKKICEKLDISKSTASGHVKAICEEKILTRIDRWNFVKGPNYSKFAPPEGGSEPIYWNAIHLRSKINASPKSDPLVWKAHHTPNGVEHYFTIVNLPIDGKDVPISLQKALGPKKQTLIYRLEPHVLDAQDSDDVETHLKYLQNLAWVCRKFLCNKLGYNLGFPEFCKRTPEGEFEASDLSGIISSYEKVSDTEFFDMTGPWPRKLGIPMEGSTDKDYLKAKADLVSDMRTAKAKIISQDQQNKEIAQNVENLNGQVSFLTEAIMNQTKTLEKFIKKLTPKEPDESTQMYG